MKSFLAMSGGGDRGCVLVGILDELHEIKGEMEIGWDECAGISAGALTAAMVSQTNNETFGDMVKLLKNIFLQGGFHVVDAWVYGGQVINMLDALLYHESIFQNTPMKTLIQKHFTDNKVTKVHGDNGVGKTVQYPTALLYAMTGVMDDRFSEEKVLLSDMRYDKTKNCSVAIYGNMNGRSFSIKRTYNGKKSTLQFIFDSVKVEAPTMKKIQKNICWMLFNVIVAKNVCPQRYLHKLLLQRIVWKQGGRDSNFLKCKADAFQTLLLETINKGDYCAFIKQIKSKVSAQKKILEKHKLNLNRIGVLVEERKEMSNCENLMLNAWCDHRRIALQECRDELKTLEGKNISKENIDAFIDHNINVKTLQNRVQDLMESKEGIRWNPEFTLNKLEEAYRDFKDAKERFVEFENELNHYVRCLEVFKYIVDMFYKRMCKILRQYNNNIDFSNMKTLTMLDGEPMKYLSGGEYEEESLKVYLDFQRFIKQYAHWECNLHIFDEPGTAMSAQSLQKFVDTLQPDTCYLIITHKPIKCPIEVYLN